MTSLTLEATKYRLLLELSALREQYTTLAANGSPSGGNSPSSSSDGSSPNSSEDGLGKSDRDAIEAFFNNEDDDFTRMFNQGEGRIERGNAMHKAA